MTTTMNNVELNNKELEMVNGGFKIGDRYSEEEYAAHGVTHRSYWFSKDEYVLPNGTVTDHDGMFEFMMQFPEIQEKEKNMKPRAISGLMFTL